MKDSDIHKLLSLIEDLICNRVDIAEYEDILPKLSKLMYHRYCSGENEGLVKSKLEIDL